MKTQLMTSLCALALLMPNTAFAQSPDMRNAVRDNNAHIVTNTFGNCVRSNFTGSSDECAPAVKTVAAARPVDIEKEARTVYFDFNKATITPEAAEKLNTLANTLKSDSQVSQARIFGYADRIGTDAYNEQLSKKRAESVRRYLVSRGFINTQVADTRWFGEAAPVTNCPSDLTRQQLIDCLAKDRKVEVEIDHLESK